MDEVHLAAVLREHERFLESRVAAADDDRVLVLVHRAVAVGALRNAAAFELGFAGNAEPLQARAGGDDDVCARCRCPTR